MTSPPGLCSDSAPRDHGDVSPLESATPESATRDGCDAPTVCSICLQDVDDFDAHRDAAVVPDVECGSDVSQCCELVFVLPNAATQRLSAAQRPLGLNFLDASQPWQPNIPTVVAVEPLGYADSLGIRPGWALQSAGGEEPGPACADPCAFLNHAVRHLPERLDAAIVCPNCRCVLHRECLRKWLQTGKRTCPICRSVISSGSYSAEAVEREDLRSGVVLAGWSFDLLDIEPWSWLLACFCPCVVASRNWQAAGLRGFALVRCLVGTFACFVIVFEVLAFFSNPAPCTFPNVTNDWEMIAKHVKGDCTILEDVSFICRNLSWVGFAMSLFAIRRRIAARYDIRETPAVCCLHCCGCFAWTLGQEQHHIEAANSRARADAAARVISVPPSMIGRPEQVPGLAF